MFSEVQQVDGRLIHMGWAPAANCLTLPREITFDSDLLQLLSNPLDELDALRGDVLGNSISEPQVLQKNDVLTLFSVPGAVPYDMKVTFGLMKEHLPFTAKIQFPTAFTSSPFLIITVAPPTTPRAARTVTLSGIAHLYQNTTFAFPAFASELDVRILYDRTIMEVFVAGGRSVVTYGIPDAQVPVATNVSIAAAASTPVTLTSANAWEMGCGWE
jgi:sucrose-6-phosphate hydrolase SacC (GH32 family)